MLFYVSYNTTNKQIPEMKQPTSETTNKISNSRWVSREQIKSRQLISIKNKKELNKFRANFKKNMIQLKLKESKKTLKGYPILLSPRGDTPPKKITSPTIDLTVYSGSHIPMKRGTIERFIRFEKIK